MDSFDFREIREKVINHFFKSSVNSLKLIERFGAIQIDPVSIVCQNQHLVFGARIERLSDNIESLYRMGQVVEVYAKEKCLVSKNDAHFFWPLLCSRRERKRKILDEYRMDIINIIDLIKDRGFISSSDLETKRLASIYPAWGPKKLGTMLLNFLWEIGEIIVLSRSGRNITYTLPPPDMWNPPADLYSPDDKHRLARWKRYIDGIAITDSRDIFAGFERCGIAERKKLLNNIAESGNAAVVTGLNNKAFCIVSKQVIDTETQNENCLPCFIPPLDNFLWHRPLVKDLWGFDYTWEIYTPNERRRFGPYAMPLVTNSGVFGPIDFRFDKSSGRLIGKVSESPVRSSLQTVAAAIETAAAKLCHFVGADSICLE